MTYSIKARRRELRFAAASLALFSATPSFGQDGGAAASASQPAPDSAPSQTGDSQDVLVTAQRRSERLIDVPLSVTAHSGEELDRSRIVNVEQLSRITPGLEMTFFGGWLQPAIRGVSSNGANPGDSSNVAIYLDGVYQPSQISQVLDIPDVEQVEVLKGPQGTLYGQNAAGGAIVITTREPQFELGGRLTVDIGNLNERYIRGYITGPISDTIAFSLTGSFQDRRGYNVDLVNGGHDDGLRGGLLRGKLLWRPSEEVAVTLTGYWYDRRDTSLFAAQDIDGNPLALAFFPGALAPNQPWQIAQNRPRGLDPESTFSGYGGSLRIVANLGPGTLTSVSAYSRSNPTLSADLDSTDAVVLDQLFKITNRSFTQEVNFSSRDFNGVRVTAGLFYLSSLDRYGFDLVTIPPFDVAILQSSSIRKEAGAAYAELTWAVTPELTLTGGLRYSIEQQMGGQGITFLLPGDTIPPFALTPPPETLDPGGEETFEALTPRISMRYAINDNANLYATVSRGFKSGLVDVQALASPPARSEVVDAFEIGFRGRILDQLTLHVAAFHYRYKDIQVQVQTQPNVYQYENAASARINGFELEANWRVAPGLRIGGSLSILDGEYTNYPNATVQVPNETIPNAGDFGNTTMTMDVSGNRLIRTPRWTADFNISYETAFAGGTLSFFGAMHHSDGYFAEASNRIRQNPYTTFDAEIGFSPSGDRFRFSLWGNNLTNEAIAMSFNTSIFGDAVAYMPPRRYGVRGEFRF